MTGLWGLRAAGPAEAVTLTVLIVSVLVLLGVAGLLVVAATLHRVRHLRRARRRADLLAEWTPALLDVLAGTTDPALLHARVQPRDAAAFTDSLLQYAFVVKGEARHRLDALAAPYLPARARLLVHADPHARVLGVRLLGLLGYERYADVLLRTLDDPSDLVAMSAAQILAQQQHPILADAIVARLERFQRWGPSLVTSMLTSLGSGAAPRLLAVFSDARASVFARSVAADALRWLNYLPAADAAAALLALHPDRELTAAALRLLRRLGRPAHADVVRPFCTAPDPVVRIHAVSALAALGGAAETPLLRAAFDDDSHWVAIRAAQGLLSVGEAGTLRTLAASEHARADLARQMLSETA